MKKTAGYEINYIENTITVTKKFLKEAGIYCQSRIFNTEDFGYYKIVVERPTLDEHGKPVLKKGKPVADSSLRDTENVPMTEDIEEYFQREVLPYAPDAWIDTKKTKVGYEIPMTRSFLLHLISAQAPLLFIFEDLLFSHLLFIIIFFNVYQLSNRVIAKRQTINWHHSLQ